MHAGCAGDVHSHQYRREHDQSRDLYSALERYADRHGHVPVELRRIHSGPYVRTVRDAGIGYFGRRDRAGDGIHFLPVSDGYAYSDSHSCSNYFIISELHPRRPGHFHPHRHRREYDRSGYVHSALERYADCHWVFPIEFRRIHSGPHVRSVRDAGIGYFRGRRSTSYRFHIL